MAERHAEALSPLDAATLWPQLHRLNTEVVATRTGEPFLFNAGVAATGIGRIPRLTRTIVVGVRSRLTYQGILVARELAGGAAWEVVSLRLGRDKDDATVTSLLEEVAFEIPSRGGRTLFMRFAEGSPHEDAVQRGGLATFAREDLLAPPAASPRRPAPPFRPVARPDRAAIFRLYCRAIPAEVRRHEAVTQQEFRAVLDTYACDEEFVLDGEGSLVAWSGAGGREGRVLCDPEAGGALPLSIDLVHAAVGRLGTLVVGQHQEAERRIALERGYTELGTRVIAARRLAALNPLKEAVAVPVTTRVPN